VHFALGALLFPRRLLQLTPAEKHESVWRIRNMLYEFRNVTLETLLKDNHILFLITYYLLRNGLTRFRMKRTLIKNKNAYVIAISYIYENSHIAQGILTRLGYDKDAFLEMILFETDDHLEAKVVNPTREVH
jgi:hypothetical protein